MRPRGRPLRDAVRPVTETQVVMPLPVNMSNGRGRGMHYSTLTKKKRDFHSAAFVEIYRQRLKNRMFSHITLDAELFLARRMDPDNATYRLKWAIDALVQNGVIPDDNPDHLTLKLTGPGGGPKQTIKRLKATQGCTLTITHDE